jgi:hypothetical protein
MLKRFDVVAILRRQRSEAQASVARLDEAIRVLERLNRGIIQAGGKPTRTISAAGRRRIAAAQRKRWAKLRLVKKK